MTKPWNSIEKIIALLQIIFGLLIICLVFYYNIVSINFILNSRKLSWEDLSFYKIFKKFFSAIINPSLFLISGFLLIKSNIKGWVIGLSMWLMLGFDALLIILNISPQKHIILKNSENLFLLFFTFLAFLIAIVLMSKEFRKKYEPNWKNWSMIFLIIVAFTLFDFFKDKIPI